MSDVGAVEGDGLKLTAALGTRLLQRQLAGQRGVTLDVLADGIEGDGDGLQELLALQIGPVRQIEPAAPLGHLDLEAVETESKQLLVVDREVRIPEVMLPSALMMPLSSSPFCSSVKRP